MATPEIIPQITNLDSVPEYLLHAGPQTGLHVTREILRDSRVKAAFVQGFLDGFGQKNQGLENNSQEIVAQYKAQLMANMEGRKDLEPLDFLANQIQAAIFERLILQ